MSTYASVSVREGVWLYRGKVPSILEISGYHGDMYEVGYLVGCRLSRGLNP